MAAKHPPRRRNTLVVIARRMGHKIRPSAKRYSRKGRPQRQRAGD